MRERMRYGSIREECVCLYPAATRCGVFALFKTIFSIANPALFEAYFNFNSLYNIYCFLIGGMRNVLSLLYFPQSHILITNEPVNSRNETVHVLLGVTRPSVLCFIRLEHVAAIQIKNNG